MPGQGGLGSVPEVVAPSPTIRGGVRGASGPGPPSAAASVALLWAGRGGRDKGDRSAPRSVSGARTPGSSGAGGFPDSVAGSRARPSGKEGESRRWAGAGPRRAPLRLRSLRPFRTFLPPDVPFGVSRWPLQGALATQVTQATGPETAFSVGLDSRRGVGWPRPSGLGRDRKALGVGPGAGRSPVRLKLSLLAGWSRPLFS